MSVLEVLSIVAAAVAVFLLATRWLHYHYLKRARRSIEASFELRRFVSHKHYLISSIELRDRVRRTAWISQDQLHSYESVRQTYEKLLESDLSGDHERVLQIMEQVNATKSALYDFEYAIGAVSRPVLWRIVNSGLLKALLASRLSDASTEKKASSSILGLLLGKRMDAYARAYAFGLAALGIGALSNVFLSPEHASPLALLIPAMVLLATFVNQKALELRVSRGYFGNNATEAAEFIKFIQAHSDSSDFGDGDKMRRLYPEAEREDDRGVVVVGQGAAA